MIGTTLHADLHVLDTDTHVWMEHRLLRNVPTARAGHTLSLTSVSGNKLWMIGGRSRSLFHTTYLSDVYMLDLGMSVDAELRCG